MDAPLPLPPDGGPVVVLGRRRPPWLRGRLPPAEALATVQEVLAREHLSTVCETSRCPNRGACWATGTATLQLMGEACTRACRFCQTGHGGRLLPLDPDEPGRVGRAVAALGLRYAVLTSVDRDDLPDGGSRHLAACVRSARAALPRGGVELLTPDFAGSERALARIVEARPHVLAHNLETVRRLTPRVRDRRAGYQRSLDVLGAAAVFDGRLLTKSGLMLGLGERDDEVREALDDLREAGVSVLTLGQYIPPSPRHLPAARWVPPERFAELGEEARRRGYRAVAAGPLVRSSFRAEELWRLASVGGEGWA